MGKYLEFICILLA